MKNKLRQYLHGNSYLSKTSLFIYRMLVSIKSININIDSLREFRSLQSGFVDLSYGNYKSYSNVLPGLIAFLVDERMKPVILDVGANDGWFAKIVYRFLGKETLVISFEPLKSMSQKLQAIAIRYKSYQYESYALGSTSEVIEITEYDTTGLSSLKEFSPSYQYSQDNYLTNPISKYPVNVVTLDWYLEKNRFENPIILKVDTQGFELEVLKGATKALSSGKIKAVIIEVMTIQKYSNAALYNDIFDLLHSHGYVLYDLYQSYYESNGMLSEFDCAFILKKY